jgi:hypothetical protein
MDKEMIEELVEEIMRQCHFTSYEEYTNEELREKYRRMLTEENKEKSDACC